MTVPYLNQGDLIQLLKDNGWELSNDNFWQEYNRLVFEKDGVVYVHQCKSRYLYMEVVEMCKLLVIDPPQEHIHAYYRHLRMNEAACYCDGGKLKGLKFKDCCGKID